MYSQHNCDNLRHRQGNPLSHFNMKGLVAGCVLQALRGAIFGSFTLLLLLLLVCSRCNQDFLRAIPEKGDFCLFEFCDDSELGQPGDAPTRPASSSCGHSPSLDSSTSMKILDCNPLKSFLLDLKATRDSSSNT